MVLTPSDRQRCAALRRAPTLPVLDTRCMRMTEPHYYLTRHTFLCRNGFHWILLDVTRDKYLAIHARHFDLLQPWLHGCSQQSASISCDAREIPRDTSELASELVAQDLLTTDSNIGKTAEPVMLAPAMASLNPFRVQTRFLPRLMNATAYLITAYMADTMLRRRAFRDIVRRVATRNSCKQKECADFDMAAAERAVLTFNSLRPIYPRDYLCLYDSLALLEFLSIKGLFPRWVFGVAADPFQAHCWVQEGTVVLNDTVERVSAYVPIMVI